MFLAVTGAGLGLLSFAPLTSRVGRRRAFQLFHVGGFVMTLVTFLGARSLGALLILLPLFGFLTVGMHAGYAIYFPELFPTRLRGSGAGFCFNVGRVLAAPALVLAGALPKVDLGRWFAPGTLSGLRSSGLVAGEAVGPAEVFHLTLRGSVALMALLFFAGLVVLRFAPETRDRPLPE